MKTLDNMTSAERAEYPVATGAIDYFPNALAYVARISKKANDQHNPGEPMHWAKDKSIGRGDQIARHLAQRYDMDSDQLLHAGKMAWRALEFLERLLIVGWPERPPIGFPVIRNLEADKHPAPTEVPKSFHPASADQPRVAGPLPVYRQLDELPREYQGHSARRLP